MWGERDQIRTVRLRQKLHKEAWMMDALWSKKKTHRTKGSALVHHNNQKGEDRGEGGRQEEGVADGTTRRHKGVGASLGSETYGIEGGEGIVAQRTLRIVTYGRREKSWMRGGLNWTTSGRISAYKRPGERHHRRRHQGELVKEKFPFKGWLARDLDGRGLRAG